MEEPRCWVSCADGPCRWASRVNGRCPSCCTWVVPCRCVGCADGRAALLGKPCRWAVPMDRSCRWTVPMDRAVPMGDVDGGWTSHAYGSAVPTGRAVPTGCAVQTGRGVPMGRAGPDGPCAVCRVGGLAYQLYVYCAPSAVLIGVRIITVWQHKWTLLGGRSGASIRTGPGAVRYPGIARLSGAPGHFG